MKFHYTASAINGSLTEGNLEAEDTAQLLAQLASRGLRPISIKPLDQKKELGGQSHFGGKKITIADKIFLTRYLSLMLRAGTDLFQAINILIADFKKPGLNALLIEIRDTLEKGQPFHVSFEHHPKYFSPVFINLIKAAENSGNLEQIFSTLSQTLEKEKQLRNKIRGALVYPIILLCLSVAILIFLTTFALPKIATVFSGGGFTPPTFSRIVFSVGFFINHYLFILLGSLFAIVAGGFIFSRSLIGNLFFRDLITKLPIFKGINYRIALQRFASTFSALLKAGIPIIDAMNLTADAVGHPKIQIAIRRIATEGISQGVSLGESFRKESAFPQVVSNLIAISEKAGHLDEILDTLGQFYESEIDTSIKTAITFIEPALLIFIGGIVGLIALAIIIPVYQLVGQL